MRLTTSIRKLLPTLLCLPALLWGQGIRFASSRTSAVAYDYGLLRSLPAAFGVGEFTFEMWFRAEPGPNLWHNNPQIPYSSNTWWYNGSFLLDGHRNREGNRNGTFSLQIYGDGTRGWVRWSVGDGTVITGNVWAVQPEKDKAIPENTPHILDGEWHHLTLVRRFVDGGQSRWEQWVDGVLMAVEHTPAQRNLHDFWSQWAGDSFISHYWLFGGEKYSAERNANNNDDFTGDIADVRFFSHAKSPEDIAATWNRRVTPDTPGLVGWFLFDESDPAQSPDSFAPGRVIEWNRMSEGFRIIGGPPYAAEPSGFEIWASSLPEGERDPLFVRHGLSNLARYALNLHPTDPVTEGLPGSAPGTAASFGLDLHPRPGGVIEGASYQADGLTYYAQAAHGALPMDETGWGMEESFRVEWTEDQVLRFIHEPENPSDLVFVRLRIRLESARYE